MKRAGVCERSEADRCQEFLPNGNGVLDRREELEEGTLKGMEHGVHHDPEEYRHYHQSQRTK